jgi:hypothetical protein
LSQCSQADYFQNFTTENYDFALLIFGSAFGWILFVPAFPFIIGPMIKGYKERKLVKAILLTVVSVVLLFPFAFSTIGLIVTPPVPHSYIDLNFPDGQTVRVPAICDETNHGKIYEISTGHAISSFHDVEWIYDIWMRIIVDDTTIPQQSNVQITNLVDFTQETDRTPDITMDEKGNGTFSNVWMRLSAGGRSSGYTSGNPFYQGFSDYEFSGAWACNP